MAAFRLALSPMTSLNKYTFFANQTMKSLPMLSRGVCNCLRSRQQQLNHLTARSSFKISNARRQDSMFKIWQGKTFLSMRDANKKSSKTGPVTWKTLLAFVIAGGGIVYYVKYLKDEKEKVKEAERSRSIGMASLGGPFELVDQDGKPKTDKDFLGQWVLIYFGFCHCPDICPDQLEKMTTVIETLDNTKGLPKIQPLFITVDPKRDDPASIKEYLKDFHPRLLGLTGTEAQVKTITKAYRVYFSAGPMDEDEDYIVDHTIITYLVNPEGKFVEYFGQNKTIDEITSTIGTRMINQKYAK